MVAFFYAVYKSNLAVNSFPAEIQMKSSVGVERYNLAGLPGGSYLTPLRYFDRIRPMMSRGRRNVAHCKRRAVP